MYELPIMYVLKKPFAKKKKAYLPEYLLFSILFNQWIYGVKRF